MCVDKDINYIYNYIKYYYSSIDEFKDEKYLIDISRRIKNSMLNSTFVEGKLDFYINNFVGGELKVRNSTSYKSFEIIKNHIYLLMNYYKIYHNINIENYNVALYEITRAICSKYSSEDVSSGSCDSLIEDMLQSEITIGFNKESNVTLPLNILYISSKNGELVDNRDYIRKYIYKHLVSDINKIFEYDGDINYLADLITNDICKKCINVQKLLERKCDDLINYFIMNNLFGIRYTKIFNEIYSIVSEYVNSNETYIDLPNKIEKVSMEKFRLTRYLITLGHTKEDVISGKCDEIMNYHLRIDSITVNSTICEQKETGKQSPNKFSLYLNNNSSEKEYTEMNNTISLENNEKYNIVNKLVYNDIEYVLLSNITNTKDVCIRKIIKEGINKYICRLDSDEVDIIFNKFVEESKVNNEGNN